MSNKVPKSHPRYLSLVTRNNIVMGVESGITSTHGLISQGRGEAFDYLINERTNNFARKSIDAAAHLLLKAKKPIISVNGNTAALVPEKIVELANVIPADLEINIFHGSKAREILIRKKLIKHGAKKVLLPSKKHMIKFIDHNRKYSNPDGIISADVIFVPLEDGDRCEALIRNGKKVITVDLNPLSRSARKATITIVDNITRAIPELIRRIKLIHKNKIKSKLQYDNKKNLKLARNLIKKRL